MLLARGSSEVAAIRSLLGVAFTVAWPDQGFEEMAIVDELRLGLVVLAGSP